MYESWVQMDAYKMGVYIVCACSCVIVRPYMHMSFYIKYESHSSGLCLTDIAE